MKNNNFIQQWAAPIAELLVIISLLQIGNSELSPVLDFDRNAIYQGEWWRLFTGHLMHNNAWHLGMNFGALIVILAVQGMHLTVARFLVLLIAGCLMISLDILFLSPTMMIYCGLSGWLHCLLVCRSSGGLLSRHWSSGWLILIGVFIKVIWEQIHGGNGEIITLIGSKVAVDASPIWRVHRVDFVLYYAVRSATGCAEGLKSSLTLRLKLHYSTNFTLRSEKRPFSATLSTTVKTALALQV
ncbi:MAG: rhombosortase [Rheinheimera sp.]|nr:rhombosortase [Rheinheimera sp.]